MSLPCDCARNDGALTLAIRTSMSETRGGMTASRPGSSLGRPDVAADESGEAAAVDESGDPAASLAAEAAAASLETAALGAGAAAWTRLGFGAYAAAASVGIGVGADPELHPPMTTATIPVATTVASLRVGRGKEERGIQGT